LWLRFETDPDFTLDFLIAEKLGCTVRELHQRMDLSEWVAWGVLLGRRAQAKELAALKMSARR
jgi:hypothetical protein